MNYKSNVLDSPFVPTFRFAIDPLTGAAIIAGGSSLLGGLFSSSKNTKVQREALHQQMQMFNTQMDYQRAAEQRAYDYQDKAWERETAYNDPAAQRARYQAAGLNPSLMMQGQNQAVASMGDVSQLGAPSAPLLSPPHYDDFLTPAVNSAMSAMNASAIAEKTKEEAKMLGIDNQYEHMKKRLDLANMLVGVKKTLSDISKSSMEYQVLSNQAEQIQQQIDFMDATWDSQMKQISSQNFVNQMQGEELASNAAFIQANTKIAQDLADSKIRVDDATLGLISEQVVEASARASQAREEANRIAKDTLRLTPGTPEYKQARDLIQAQIESFRTQAEKNQGVSFLPGWVTKDMKRGYQSIKRGIKKSLTRKRLTGGGVR